MAGVDRASVDDRAAHHADQAAAGDATQQETGGTAQPVIQPALALTASTAAPASGPE
ncbi:hypothetical protein U1Q18_013539, partial [Sarracenia purpurea var. burkii]